MKNRINVLLMLSIIAFGGFIAYSGMQPMTVMADPPPIYRFTDIPKEKSVISLDLNTNTFALEGTADIEINVQQKDSVRTITKWKNRIVEKLVVLDNRTAPFLIKPLVRNNKIEIPEVSKLTEISVN